ncbi:hypothetical protein OS493_006530 [Desmophyllum pertusum]|uniref:Major facilitator superfamily associated domain-containing protein n=1 Tax=Desmophyllum pertusum TaxID=174260 RepID=A0A9X0A4Z8_9CNID|nr:hypothetical protein OS493_006530 [Desmophyllum pertusum]
MLVGLHESFGLWYLEELGAEPYMLGIASGLRYTIALVGYVISGSVVNKFGQACTIAACLLLYVAVYMSLSFVLNPWLGVALFRFPGTVYMGPAGQPVYCLVVLCPYGLASMLLSKV